jgi:hypothetical protein
MEELPMRSILNKPVSKTFFALCSKNISRMAMKLCLVLFCIGTAWAQPPNPNFVPAAPYSANKIYANTGPILLPFNGKLYLAYRSDVRPYNVVLWVSPTTTPQFTQVSTVSIAVSNSNYGQPQLGVFNGRLYITYWSASTGLLTQVSSSDGVNFTTPVSIVVGPGSPQPYTNYTPVLVGYQQTAYLIYIGPGSTNTGGVTPEPFIVSGGDGVNFINAGSLSNFDPVGAKSSTTVALRNDSGGTKMIVTWTMGSSSNPATCAAYFTPGFACTRVISPGALLHTPAIGVLGSTNAVYVGGAGIGGSHNLYIMGSYDGNSAFSGLTNIGGAMSSSPVMTEYNNRLFVAFRSCCNDTMYLGYADN